MPDALPADHPGELHRSRASGRCSASCCCSAGWRWSGWCAPSSCAARNFDYVRAARALGVLDARIMFRHILPNAMVASAHLPAVHPGRLDHHPDRARLPGLRPAAGLAVARRAAAAGQEQPAGAVARLHRLRRAGAACCRCWSSSARRCATPSIRARCWHEREPGSGPLLEVRDLSVTFGPATMPCAPCARRQLRRRARRDRGAGRRIGLGQVGDRAVDPAAPALSDGAATRPAASGSTARSWSARRRAMLRPCAAIASSMIFQEPMTSLNPLHTHRAADRRGPDPAQGPCAARPPAAHAGAARAGRHPRGRERGSTPTRTSSRAASASAS